MGFAMGLGMLGKYYHLLGSRKYAEKCIAYCLEEAVRIQDWHIASVVLGVEGCNLLEQHRYEEAEQWIDRSVQLTKKLHIPFFECEALYFKSLLRGRQNQYEGAAEAAEESLKIAIRLKRRDLQVKLHVQLLHLKTCLGWISPSDAMDELQYMAEQYAGEQDQAAIRFAMWLLKDDSPELRTTALSLNEALYRKSGKQEYFGRLQELGGFGNVIEARPIPKLAAEAVQQKQISSNLLGDIDRFLLID
jgi:tetratricopeptide (TPR) repeat protein